MLNTQNITPFQGEDNLKKSAHPMDMNVLEQNFINHVTFPTTDMIMDIYLGRIGYV
jgi:hypothetical protein